MIPYEYVLFGQIQNAKADFYAEHGRGLSFQNAVQALIDRKEYQCGIPQKPDFLSWDLTNYQELCKRIGKIPVALDELRNVKNIVQNDIRRLSIYNQVQISAEACYSDLQMISVDYFSVCYVLEGSCRLKLLSGERLMRPGELCMIPPGVPYAIFTALEDLVLNIVSAKEHFKENFSQLLYRDNIVSAFFRRALFEDAREPVFFTMESSREINSLIQHLFSEFVKRDSYSETLFNNYLQIFYANIIRTSEQPNDRTGSGHDLPSRSQMPTILNYIRENYHTLTLGTLAKRFHYDSAYLSRLIKETTGENYRDIVTELKIAEAAELLEKTDRSIEEIAEIVGYATADHFGYMFKNAKGLSPRQYRKLYFDSAR